MFSALTLLLLLSFLFLLFLGDYQVKMRFQQRLKNYYLAKSLKIWSEAEFEKNPQQTHFSFVEGSVQVEWVPIEERYRYRVKIQEQDFHFYGKSQESEDTFEKVKTSTEEIELETKAKEISEDNV